MELLTLLKDFGLPGIFIGILIYIVKFQERSNATREVSFRQERERWLVRDNDWVTKVLTVLHDNTKVMTKFSSSLEQLSRDLSVVGQSIRINDEKPQAVHEYLESNLSPQLLELTKTVEALRETLSRQS